MAIHTILAMTGHEIRETAVIPSKIAWMACQFSPHDAGLISLPAGLPHGSMIILNDQIPINGHDPDQVARQLAALHPGRVLLDFQRPESEQAATIAGRLVQALPCPVGVSIPFAEGLDCPIFLPPVPPHIPIGEHLAPWTDREIWLELALDATEITVTSTGSTVKSVPIAQATANAHRDDTLHCHYTIGIAPDVIRFYLYRTPEDITALLHTVQFQNITHAIGLFQELGQTVIST